MLISQNASSVFSKLVYAILIFFFVIQFHHPPQLGCVWKKHTGFISAHLPSFHG